MPGFLSPSLGYGATDVTLNLQSMMTATSGLGGNQLSVARALDTAFNAGPGLGAMPGLFGLSNGQLPAALELLSGDNASVGNSTAITAGGQFAALLANRATTRRAEEQSAWLAGCAAPGATACDGPDGPRNWSAWGTAFGGAQWLNADPVTGSNAAQQTIGGGAFGGDYRVGPQTLLGIAVGLSGSNYWVGATGANGRATGVHVGLYGQHDWQGVYVNAALAYSHFDGSAIRPINGIGTPETAKSYATSNQLAGRVEIGRPFEVARFDGGALGLTPFAAVQPAVLWTPGIGESSVTATGAPGVFALNYQAQSTGSLPTFLGVQLDATTELERAAADGMDPGFLGARVHDQPQRRGGVHGAAGQHLHRRRCARRQRRRPLRLRCQVRRRQPDLAVRQRQRRAVQPRPEPCRHRRAAHRVVTPRRRRQ